MDVRNPRDRSYNMLFVIKLICSWKKFFVVENGCKAVSYNLKGQNMEEQQTGN